MYIDNYEIKRLNNKEEEFVIIVYLDDQLSEFADELGTKPHAQHNLVTTVRQIVFEKYPYLKVTMVKVVVGGMIAATLPLTVGTNTATAAPLPTQGTTQSTGISYTVAPGDTLWSISRTFQTTVDQIKRANNVTSDTLVPNQRLIIPVESIRYTVVAGDSLSAIAKKFGVTVEQIRRANHLTTDMIRVGQQVTIPSSGGTSTVKIQPIDSVHTVVSGDTLFNLSQRYGVTVNAIRTANQLTSDSLKIGQRLVIPIGNTNLAPTPTPTAPTTTTYTVVAGDSLWGIAQRFQTTVDGLRSTNNLRTDTLTIGQTLTIPASITGTTPPPPAPPVNETRSTFTYAVQSGDNLSVIALRFGVTVDAIRTANNLRSDLLQVGQVLTIPNGLNAPTQSGKNSISYSTHTVISGDNVWDLSIRYGIPQTELLRVNNLTLSSRLSIGQSLTIPVHHIAVKPAISVRHGELLDWWTEAQYVFPIGKVATVTDFATGQSFRIKRTIGANHADSETLTGTDTNIARSIWGGFSWTPRAVIVEVDGRKLAASMSFMPHDIQYITNNGITGHFDVYFSNSTRHVDGRPDASHQAQVERAAGVR